MSESLPPLEHPIWNQLIKGEVTCNFEFLATQIFLGRVRLVIFNDNSPESVLLLSKELREIFEQNLTHPTIIRDMAELHIAERSQQ